MVLPLWVVENRPSPLLWPLAYTTACTGITVQAVTRPVKTDRFELCSFLPCDAMHKRGLCRSAVSLFIHHCFTLSL